MRSQIADDWAALSRLFAPRDWAAPVVFGVGADLVRAHAGGQVVFLASPIALSLGQVSDVSQVMAARSLVDLARQGVAAVSPVVLGAAMLEADMHLSQKSFNGWAAWAARLRNAARVVWVPAVRGWSACPMVWRDVQWAGAHGVPVMVEAEEVEQ